MKARYRWFMYYLCVAGGLLCCFTPARAYMEAALSLGSIVAQTSHVALMRVEAVDQQKSSYVEAALSLGSIVAQANVVLMRVEAVDQQKNLIVYRKVRDIKGKHPHDLIKHNIGRTGLRPDEWAKPMTWAEVGKLAMFFHLDTVSETCIDNWWYRAESQGEWWRHVHGEPFLLRSYAGSPERLAGIVSAMLEGKEVVAPCMVDGNKEDLHQARAKIQRLKVSLKLLDYNPKRDFVGWGAGPGD